MPSVYHDRKMLKWLPFEALEAQGDYLRELHDTLSKEEKPILSEDQCVLMQYTLEEAIRDKKTVQIIYFEAGHRYQCCGHVQGIDKFNGILFVGANSVLFNDILEIELR